jgi:hypothetical protein
MAGRLFVESPHGADLNTLTAKGTITILYGGPHGRLNGGGDPPLLKIDGVIVRLLLADPNTTAAENALVHIPDVKGVGVLQAMGTIRVFGLGKTGLLNAQLISRILKLTLAVAGAGEAIQGMPDKNKLQHSLPGLQNPGGMGINHHPRSDGGGAGGEKLGGVLRLHQADATSSEGAHRRMVAEGGDMDFIGLSRLKDGHSRFGSNICTVHGGVYACHNYIISSSP